MAENSNPLAYNFKGDLINELEGKKGIDYECPGCGNILRIRGGDIIGLHFYHVENIECDGESYWHKIYKKVFSESKTIKMNDKTYKFDRVELEKNFGDIRPDAIGYINDVPHLIEFWHTHKVDIEKAQKIINMQAICIEIKVQPYLKAETLIEQFLTQSTDYRNYIYPEPVRYIKKENKKKSIVNTELGLKNHWTWNESVAIYYDYKIPDNLKYPCFYYHQVGNYISYIKQIDAKHSIIWLENEWVQKEVEESARYITALQLLLWERLLPETIENSEKNPSEVVIQHSDGSGSVYTFHKHTDEFLSWIWADENGELIYECKFFFQDNYPRAYKNSLGHKWTNNFDNEKKRYIWQKL